MLPKAKITKEIIPNTVLEIAREAGFESTNTRSISGRLQCSTWLISTCYENMEELRKEFLDFAYELYSQYVESYNSMEYINPYLTLPLSYIEFTREGMNLLGLLFISHMDLSMAESKDFYMKADNGGRERVFSDIIGTESKRAKAIFINLFFYSHGIAVLAAVQKITLDESHVEKMAANMLTTLIKQKKPDWTLSVSDITEST